MKRILSKFMNEIHALIWTVAGTALVLITLSGAVQMLALQISAIAFVLHIFGVLIKKD